MQDKLLCKFNLFDIDQKIYLYSAEKNKVIEIGSCAIDNISEMIIGLLVNKHINELDLSGNASYVQKTIQDIKKYQETNYELQNVRIYINGKVFGK